MAETVPMIGFVMGCCVVGTYIAFGLQLAMTYAITYSLTLCLVAYGLSALESGS